MRTGSSKSPDWGLFRTILPLARAFRDTFLYGCRDTTNDVGNAPRQAQRAQLFKIVLHPLLPCLLILRNTIVFG